MGVLSRRRVAVGVSVGAGLLAAFLPLARGATVYFEGDGSGTRWRDIAGNRYKQSQQNTYTYPTAASQSVSANYSVQGGELNIGISATGLKPNFAYQVKLDGNVATYGTGANELLGRHGRYWYEEWDPVADAWVPGDNFTYMNDKGGANGGLGEWPNPNDLQYDDWVGVTDSDPQNPTGLKYRFTGYRLIGYFVTNGSGATDTTIDFTVDSSYHVLWRTDQSSHTHDGYDGTITAHTVDPSGTGWYNQDPSGSVSIYPEWERLPVGSVSLLDGDYEVDLALTEEGFHEDGWPTVMRTSITFTIPEPSSPLLLAAAAAGACVRRRRASA